MSKISRDCSFEREGVSLESWLWRLFDQDRSVRMAAIDVLSSMRFGIPKFAELADPDIEFEGTLDEDQPERFYRHVGSIVSSPTFDKEEFLVALALYCLLLIRNFRISVDRSTESLKKSPSLQLEPAIPLKSICDELRTSPGESTNDISYRFVHLMPCGRTEPELDQATKRLQKWLTHFESPQFLDDLDQRFEIRQIIVSSGLPLIKVPEVILVLMEFRETIDIAYEILYKIGPTAQSFSSELLQRIQSTKKNDDSAPTAVLGSVARNNPEIVRELLNMIRSDNPTTQENGLKTLATMGAELGNFHSEVLERLLELIKTSDLPSIIDATASVGRHQAEVRAKILEMTKPRPPRIVTVKIGRHSASEWSYDKTMCDRGTAIEAIRYFIDYPEETVPVLIDALDTFEEYDSDYCYGGTSDRVSGIIEVFGLSAAPWAYRLAEIYRDKVRRGEYPIRLLWALGDMGPSAGAALTILESMRRKGAKEIEELDSPPDRDSDTLEWAIYQINNLENLE